MLLTKDSVSLRIKKTYKIKGGRVKKELNQSEFFLKKLKSITAIFLFFGKCVMALVIIACSGPIIFFVLCIVGIFLFISVLIYVCSSNFFQQQIQVASSEEVINDD